MPSVYTWSSWNELSISGASTAPTVTWQIWNVGTATTSSASTSTRMAWNSWCEDQQMQTIGATSTAVKVWVYWNGTATSATTVRSSQPNHAANQLPEPTPEERERRLRKQEEYQRKREEELRKREEAVKRAEGLLRMFLTEEQLAEFERNKCFHVTAPSGTRYEIGGGSQHGNVVELNAEGKKVRRYCIQPFGALPNPDAWLAQKLMLETDEESFKRIANSVTLLAA